MLLLKPELVRGTARTPRFASVARLRRPRTEDASNLIDTGGARVMALADLFQDQLDKARDNFNKIQQPKGYSMLDASQLFRGTKRLPADCRFEGSGRHRHRHAAVLSPAAFGRGRRRRQTVYLEKPVAVDVRGAMKVMEIGKRAEGKLSLDVGFQIRDCPRSLNW